MKRFVLLILFLALPTSLFAEGKPATKKEDEKSYQIPYRLTQTNHIVIRAKINGKGPFNFILDTGAPALFVSTKVCGKLGIEPDDDGWGTFTTFEIEGGAVLVKAKGRIDDPFQLEGMNGLGLSDVHLDGIIGYNVLARFRLTFDFTRDKMTWTRLTFEPPMPLAIRGKVSAPGGLDTIGSAMKMLGAFLGKRINPGTVFRGFLGFELNGGDKELEIKNVLPGSPAATAGLRSGDRMTHFQEKEISDRADLLSLASRVSPGQNVQVTVTRNGETQKISFKAAEGF